MPAAIVQIRDEDAAIESAVAAALPLDIAIPNDKNHSVPAGVSLCAERSLHQQNAGAGAVAQVKVALHHRDKRSRIGAQIGDGGVAGVVNLIGGVSDICHHRLQPAYSGENSQGAARVSDTGITPSAGVVAFAVARNIVAQGGGGRSEERRVGK